MLSLCEDGQIYKWDLETRKCVHKFIDEGAVKSTTIDLSKNGEYLATAYFD